MVCVWLKSRLDLSLEVKVSSHRHLLICVLLLWFVHWVTHTGAIACCSIRWLVREVDSLVIGMPSQQGRMAIRQETIRQLPLQVAIHARCRPQPIPTLGRATFIPRHYRLLGQWTVVTVVGEWRIIGNPGCTLLVRDVADWPTQLAYLLLGCLLWMMIFGDVLVARSDFVRKRCLVGLVLLRVVIVMMINLSGHPDITSELGLWWEGMLLLLDVHIAMEGKLEHHGLIILQSVGLPRGLLFWDELSLKRVVVVRGLVLVVLRVEDCYLLLRNFYLIELGRRRKWCPLLQLSRLVWRRLICVELFLKFEVSVATCGQIWFLLLFLV